jgi:hypothetical protein
MNFNTDFAMVRIDDEFDEWWWYECREQKDLGRTVHYRIGLNAHTLRRAIASQPGVSVDLPLNWIML